MKFLFLGDNQLTGTSILCILPGLVYESTADGFVSENALAGAIPTEIGLLTQLKSLGLSYNQLTGASKKLT